MAFGLGMAAAASLFPPDAGAAKPSDKAAAKPSVSSTARPAVVHAVATGRSAQARQMVVLTSTNGSRGPWRLTRYTRGRYAYGGIQCVPYARTASGIQIKGNAANWWENADGVYERGQVPEEGSVLNFRSTGRMRLGHVAVVRHVVSAREIEIDHANWWGPGAGRGSVSKNVSVVDVSPNNDWSQVRVELGHSGDYGSVYPTYGFIYGRPDTGRFETVMPLAPQPPVFTAATVPAKVTYQEVAEVPTTGSH